jgi:hypothetical protein
MVLLAGANSLQAQQITGTPGSADATVTIDGKQLPPPQLHVHTHNIAALRLRLCGS